MPSGVKPSELGPLRLLKLLKFASTDIGLSRLKELDFGVVVSDSKKIHIQGDIT